MTVNGGFSMVGRNSGKVRKLARPAGRVIMTGLPVLLL
jgi:hypothetical protein